MMNIDKLVLTDEEIRATHPYWEELSDDAVKRVRVISLATVKKAEPLIRQNEREKILDYLEYWWRKYESNTLTGDSRHTFQLPEDWEEAIRRGKPPYKPEDWQALKATVEKEG